MVYWTFLSVPTYCIASNVCRQTKTCKPISTCWLTTRNSKWIRFVRSASARIATRCLNMDFDGSVSTVHENTEAGCQQCLPDPIHLLSTGRVPPWKHLRSVNGTPLMSQMRDKVTDFTHIFVAAVCLGVYIAKTFCAAEFKMSSVMHSYFLSPSNSIIQRCPKGKLHWWIADDVPDTFH